MRPDVFTGYRYISHFDRSVFAMRDAPALFDDAYKNHISCFITLLLNALKNHCKSLLYVLRQNCEVATALPREIWSSDATPKHTIKQAFTFFADLWFVKEPVTFPSYLTYNLFPRNTKFVPTLQLAALYSKYNLLKSSAISVFIHRWKRFGQKRFLHRNEWQNEASQVMCHGVELKQMQSGLELATHSSLAMYHIYLWKQRPHLFTHGT